jgi:hypothetical protein
MKIFYKFFPEIRTKSDVKESPLFGFGLTSIDITLDSVIGLYLNTYSTHTLYKLFLYFSQFSIPFPLLVVKEMVSF